MLDEGFDPPHITGYIKQMDCSAMTRRLICLLIVLASFFAMPTRAATPDGFSLLAAGGAGGWLNVTRPLTVDDMQGRLVLLDFWTYGCINCIQVIPDLEYLEEKYGDQLLILGVHSAKFDGEKGNARILSAAKRFGLKHPVINDSDYRIWKSYQVGAWPTLILLDSTGREVNRYTGEGNRAAMDRDIEKAAAGQPAPVALESLIAQDDHSSILSFPARISAGDQMLFIADAGHNRILGVGLDGKIQFVIGSGARGDRDGALYEATFNQPRGLVYTQSGLYIADTGNHKIRRVDLKSGQVTTVAGTGVRGRIREGVDLPGATTAIASPWDLEDMGDGRHLAIAMAGIHQIWTLDTLNNTVSVTAGNGREDIVDGPAGRAEIAQTSGLSRSGDALFFVDAESSALRVFKDNAVTTLIGTGLFDFGNRDGVYPEARLQHPQGLYADEAKIIVADTYNNALRIYDRKARNLSTLTLTGAALNEPGDVFLYQGVLYVVDTNHHDIKKVNIQTGAVTAFTIRDIKK
jgi:thiol-disulfide isomerase/thioredoxin